ncbi:hypothetical protein K505DRAFT_330275 [Melanomma pulvis-pyrius CBS 109.77]|uniref:gamma-glutamylcyclotransferase n=1 Tax=Melanomma pulvis-pyrius CBS 109.77 TaxID=1314802 RepID=A0A6A6WR37_9PLEO|nr:hypothetical protein K505DRAFT_330275 [Melanomma pulvis-pyrius CBS 109.77]
MASSISAPTAEGKAKPTTYFGYGSNLWLHQMALRCPTSKYLGVARLKGYRWIINARGYANIVEVEDSDTENNYTNYEDKESEGKNDDDDNDDEKKYSKVVFGLVYALQAKDEAKLDVNEGVPEAYTKEYLECEFWAAGKDVCVPRSMLVYIDRKRVEESTPKKEYVVRMNHGIKDAVSLGVPEGYVKAVMRRFIPEPEEEAERVAGRDPGVKGRSEVEEAALRQAVRFVDEN